MKRAGGKGIDGLFPIRDSLNRVTFAFQNSSHHRLCFFAVFR